MSRGRNHELKAALCNNQFYNSLFVLNFFKIRNPILAESVHLDLTLFRKDEYSWAILKRHRHHHLLR